MNQWLARLFIVMLFNVLVLAFSAMAQDYVGSTTCMPCHNTTNATLDYNIWEEYNKTGHPYKLNEVNGGPPTYPANTSPGVSLTPSGTSWDDFSYVIGGYGWKARYVKPDGFVFTANDSAQYNLENESWVAYHLGQDTPYNYDCFKCHTTGPDPSGSWNGVPTDSLGTFSEPGIRCEGCHGPGSEHVSNPTGIHPPNAGDILKFERCGDCHQRGGATNAIPASGGYIRHHEQINEMKASKHRDGIGAELTCASCHDVHIPGRYPDAAGEGLSGIKTDCASCHPNHDITITNSSGTSVKNIDCVDCHMPKATKSAVAMQVGNGWQGDVPTHIWQINTDPVPRDSMFADGFVKLDENSHGAVTLDFVCLSCHQNEGLTWAASYADDIHTNGIITAIDADLAANLPDNFELLQNYPNPFNPSTTIEYRLPKSSEVKMVLYNVLGQEIATLVDGMRPAGVHKITLDGSNLASGMYVYRLETNDQHYTKKMMLMK